MATITTSEHADRDRIAALRFGLSVAWAVAALGVGLRIYHYLLNPPVWCDELWILRNVVHKGFLELLGPLSDIQAAPPLFLWLERLLWLLLGDNIFTLRLLPVLAGCASVALFVPVARRCIGAGALPWAVALFACSDPILNYTCEVKPYVIDAFLAVATCALFLGTQRWSLVPRLLLCSALAPVVIFLSYPGCFLCGTLLLAFLPLVWENRRKWAVWTAYGLFVVCTFLPFILLVLGPVRAQRSAALEAVWEQFPDWHRPWTVPLWTFDAFARLFEHLWRPTGPIFLLPALLGVISLWRNNRRGQLLLLGTPVLLGVLAAWIGAFPFESRVVLYTAPALALLIGEGIAVGTAWLYRKLLDDARFSRRTASLATLGVLSIVLLVPMSRTAYHVVFGYTRLTQETWPER